MIGIDSSTTAIRGEPCAEVTSFLFRIVGNFNVITCVKGVVALCILLLGLLLSIHTAMAAEAEPLMVAPGSITVVAGGKEKIDLTGAVPSGARVVNDTAAGNPFSILIYSAPAIPSPDITTITYTQANLPVTARIMVASEPGSDPALISKAARLLFSMFVLAVILESAFAVLFNWRVFLEFFDGRGVRTVVMFVASYLFVDMFHTDFVADLLRIYAVAASSTLETHLLTALVLAGGSASVNALMVALNLRQNRKTDDVVPKPPKTKAWVAVKVHRQRAVTIVEVLQIAKEPTVPPSEQLLGLIRSENLISRLSKYFWRDLGRVPVTAGLEVEPKNEYTFIIHGKDSTGVDIFCDVSGTTLTPVPGGYNPSPRAYSFAPGAVVDFVVTF